MRCWCPSCGGTDIQERWFEGRWDNKDMVNQCQDCGKIFQIGEGEDEQPPSKTKTSGY